MFFKRNINKCESINQFVSIECDGDINTHARTTKVRELLKTQKNASFLSKRKKKKKLFFNGVLNFVLIYIIISVCLPEGCMQKLLFLHIYINWVEVSRILGRNLHSSFFLELATHFSIPSNRKGTQIFSLFFFLENGELVVAMKEFTGVPCC